MGISPKFRLQRGASNRWMKTTLLVPYPKAGARPFFEYSKFCNYYQVATQQKHETDGLVLIFVNRFLTAFHAQEHLVSNN